MADEYNNDIIQMLPGNDQTPPMYSAIDGESVVDRDSTGRIQSIKLDMTKAQNTFVDLRSVFNANQVDGKVLMPVSLYQYGQPFNLSGWTGEIHGLYPDKKTTFVLNTAGGNTGTIYNFLWDTGVFQTTGKYTFQFVFKNATTGETVSSKWCFFEVEPDILSMAVNFPEGIEPYDNEYQAWKSKIEAEITQLQTQITNAQDSLKTITGTATNTLGVLQDYEKNAQGYVNTAMTAKFGTENHWTAKQHFDDDADANNFEANTASISNLTITGWFDAKEDLTVEQGLHVKGTADLPSSVTYNNSILKQENGNLAAGLFPCEGYWYATSGNNAVHSSMLNGVTGYISFKKFHYTPRDGDIEWGLMEIHMNCDIPTSAFGKPIVQFGQDNIDGIDQTPFIMGGHIFEFDIQSATLICNGYATGYSSTTTMDAGMI